jgi:hypothetical protein
MGLIGNGIRVFTSIVVVKDPLVLAGYAIGALLTGILADWFNVTTAIAFIGGLTLVSALVIWMRMPRHLSS